MTALRKKSSPRPTSRTSAWRAHVSVAVLGHGLRQRGNGLSARCPAHHTRRTGARRVIEIAEFVDCRLELRGGYRLRRARLLSACGALTTKDTKDTKEKARTYP